MTNAERTTTTRLQTGINPEDPERLTEDYQGDVSGQIIHVDFSRERFGVSA
jgi:hypothetical protein